MYKRGSMNRRRRPSTFRRRRSGFKSSYRRGGSGRAWKGLRAGYNRVGGFYNRFNKRPSTSELKYNDINGLDNAIITDSGTRLTLLSGQPLDILVGPKATERIGRQIILKSIHLRGVLTLPGTATSSAVDQVRILIVWDTQTNGQAISPSDFLQETTIGGATGTPVQADIDAFKNMQNSDRFRLLYDKIFSLKAAATDPATSVPVERRINIFRKLNIPITYDDIVEAGGGVARIKSNHVTIWAISRHNIARISNQIRIRYTG